MATLYVAAVLELSEQQIFTRVAEARRAMREQLQSLHHSGVGVERRALLDGLNVLHDIREMESKH